jgi:hypothetical protein
VEYPNIKPGAEFSGYGVVRHAAHAEEAKIGAKKLAGEAEPPMGADRLRKEVKVRKG